eukprot:CAMPEP_0115721588 /NCGR_PEP_ID=MMETSP0272-20121206/79178_1 /TAXON_ID=71861 /ORGANISM="Scrippsiella trochoidea, Strain CCMP3099" /LENGTH=48 /DNA_ID= /DNA_START= /DNA_END= /DNA_ORIENTATION=
MTCTMVASSASRGNERRRHRHLCLLHDAAHCGHCLDWEITHRGLGAQH